ncbi:MAG TPA: hypothetical protein VNG69_13945 [Casimicrobiaceae bacterium]|nr:hypothetical protein [Casimicrobiaceae bacterium]
MGNVFGSKTMLEVLRMNGQSGYADLGAHIAAALLNSASGLTPVLSQPQIRVIWNEYVARGYYEPAAGKRWTAYDIIAYLQTTATR